MPRAKQLQRARGDDEAVAPLDAAFKLVDALPVPVFFKSRDGRYLGVNRAWEEFFGIRGESFIGKQVADLYPQDPAIGQKHAAMDRELYARPGRQSYEITVRARDGTLRDTIYYKATYKDARGEVAGLIGTIVDITASKSAESALRVSEERYRRTFELAGSGLAQVGLDGRFMRVNRRLCEMFGYSEAELVGMSVKDISHPEDRDAVDQRRLKLIAGEVDTLRIEKRYLRKDGTPVWVHVAIAMERDAAGRPLYAISVLDDITARRQAEDALLESEARYRSTFELAGSGIAHIGLDRKFIRVNRRLCEILGYPEHELIGMTGRQISHPGDLEVINTQRKRLYAGEIDHVHVEKRYLRKDGSTVWVAFSMVLERDAEGRPFYEIAIFDDITERKRAERALRESEARFRSLTQLSSDWYWEQDETFALRFMSQRMAEKTGLAAAAFIGRKRWDQPALNLTEEDWARHRSQLERHEPFRDFEMERPGPAGGARWVSVTGEPVYDENRQFRGYRGVGSDITERKQAEAALRRAHDELAKKAEELQRSNAELEQFAYVASHDLQEPLRMVSSYTQLLAKRYKDQLPAEAQEFMHFTVDGAARMKQLIEDLLAYSRVGTKGKELVPVALEAPLKRALTNLRAAIQESGASVTSDALPTVDADEVQLAQVFQNLIGNALKFRGKEVPRIHVGAVEEAGEWHISIADNGIGIEPQYFDRIFMLFQRLHAMGEYPGTGIGLAICKKVAERHGGRIWVTSQPGAGSTFHFTLPKKEFP
ncbi:MAG TPA: PAS domain S-box protein [Burkholderiales bacterium]|nr:PAS domain S-box protein [Burkholderiales bacterium]